MPKKDVIRRTNANLGSGSAGAPGASSVIISDSDDAETADGLHASPTPTPGMLLPLDGAGLFPGTVIQLDPSGGLVANEDGLAIGRDWVFQEDHSAECDGARTQFLTAHQFAPNTTLVALNGLIQRVGHDNDYTEDAACTGFTFEAAPEAGDALVVAYLLDSGGLLPLSGPYVPDWGDLPVTLQLEIHTHSETYTPAQLVGFYSGAGYDALAITDHNVVTVQPAGMTIAPQGSEASAPTGHMTSFACGYLRGAETDIQTIIDGIVAAGGQAILNHPKWSVGHSYPIMATLTGYLGIEIHNALCVTGAGVDPITYPGFDVEDWDALLTNVRRDIWGFATDDLHGTTATQGYDIGHVVAFAKAATEAELLNSLINGNFVADVSNSGVTLLRPVITRTGVEVACPGATSIRFIGDGGLLLSEVTGEEGAYAFTADDTYVRIEVVGDYTEAFGAALDTTNRWGTSGGTWVVAGGILSQTDAPDAVNLLVCKRHICGDIEVQIDVRLPVANSQQAGVLVNLLDTTRYYYIRLANAAAVDSPNTLSVWKFNNGVNTELGNAAFVPAANTWYRIRCLYTRETGQFQAKVWDPSGAEPGTWDVTVTDTTWGHGAVALRCRQLADFDNLYAKGFKSYYQPIPVADWSS